MNTKKPDPMGSFLDAYLQELQETPDGEVLRDTSEDAEREAGRSLLEAARAEAGKRRLGAARIGLTATREKPPQSATGVTSAVARAYLQQAANDSRYTLAARGLEEMSDEDVLLAYAQLKQLEDESTAGANQNPPE